jgi:transposase
MSKTFRAWNWNQEHLFPRSLREYVPEGHPAHFIVKLVSEELDLREVLSSYTESRGYPPHSPKMMTAVLLYGYMRGVYSSRKLSQACKERTDFMVVSGMSVPDHRPLAMFRTRHRVALSKLFVQVLELCAKANLMDLQHVAVDGTRIKGNASLDKNASYKDLREGEASLVERWLREAEEKDQSEDIEFGEDKCGDEFPKAEEALRRVREAKKALEVEDEVARKERDEAIRKGKKPKLKSKARSAPADGKQYNFTDPESGVMRTAKGYLQGYNAQAAVDTKKQIIVACEVSRAKNDLNELIPLMSQIQDNCKKQATEMSADSGYCSHENLNALKSANIRGYIPRSEKIADRGIVREMSLRLKRAGRRSRFRLRKITVEPVFGIIKSARGFSQFLLRGLDKVKVEWSLVCTAHNLWKLAGAQRIP